ncbi:uncharacterized protein LOC143177260 [Calliopsis andreniformis]|uniref:uncharacterized protein LOC143177260 n=1 Tax=Calliopsis andreniformis TaxID=337506 RepID=UPI003FCDC203
MHYVKILLRQYFTCWRKYIVFKRKKKALLAEAITIDKVHCLKKCIKYWKQYVIQLEQKKFLQDKVVEAHQFYSKRLLKKCIKAWIDISEIKFQQNKIENSILYYENKLLKKYFNFWKIYYDFKVQKVIKKEYHVNESIVDKVAYEKAETFYNHKCLQRVFLAWLKWYNEKILNCIKMNEIESIFENRLKITIFSNWRLYIHEKKCKQRKIFSSQNFYRKKLIVKILRKLHNYALYRKQKKIKLSYLNDKSKIIMQQLQIIFIEKWRKSLYIIMQEKQKLNQAIKFWEQNLISKYFLHWKEFSQHYKVKILQKKKLYELTSAFLLKKYVLHWYAKLQDVLEIHKKEAFATSMIDYKIMKRCWLSWKQYIAQKIEIRNSIETAKELHRKLLLHEGLKEILRNSLHNIDYKYGIQLEDAAIRSFKNFEILKEYFDKWHSLVYVKNNLKILRETTKNTDSQFTDFQTSHNYTFNDIENTSLVIPEYIKKKNTVSTTSDLFVTAPSENWLFNFF